MTFRIRTIHFGVIGMAAALLAVVGLTSCGGDEADGSGDKDECATCAGECCDGICIDTAKDVENCGGCGVTCSADNGTAACDAGECVVGSCAAGFVDCNNDVLDGCEAMDPGPPTMPTLEAPMIGHYTGSVHAKSTGTLRPKFTWKQARSGACDVNYELQLDDSCLAAATCAFDSPELHAKRIDGAEFTPESDLEVSALAPVGTRYHWRVRACDALERCSEWTESRYLDVGRVREDLNGDGYAEVVTARAVAGAPANTEKVVVLYGAKDFSAQSAKGEVNATPTNSGYEDNPVPLLFLGDVNGDGFGDLGAGGNSVTSGRVAFVILGGATTLSLLTLTMPEPHYGAFSGVYPLADFDGDGFADFAVGQAGGNNQRAYVYFGKAGLDSSAAADKTIERPVDSTELYLGESLGTVGDLNLDGLPDALLVAPQERVAYVFAGSRQRDVEPETTFSLVAADAPSDCSNSSLTGAGDLNGDGFGDAVVTCWVTGHVSLYAGAATLPTGAARRIVINRAQHVASGDLDGDGYPDLVMTRGTPFGPSVLRGGANLPTSPEKDAFGSLASGHGVAIADHNGDGSPDVAVLTLGAPIKWYRGDGTFGAGTPVDLTEQGRALAR
jgi:hypothetical protein